LKGFVARVGEGSSSEGLTARLVDPLVGPEWDQLVLSHPDANPFHSSAWAKVLARTYGHKPFYLHCSANDRLLALVPLLEVNSRITGRRGVSLPFSDFCGPLLFPGCDRAPVYHHLTGLAQEQGWKFLEIREKEARPELDIPCAQTYFGHSLSLEGTTDELFGRFSSSVRRAVRKAEKSGLKSNISQDEDALSDFCRLHARTRRRHGVPPQPHSFFQILREEMLQKGLGFVVRAHYESRCVAAALFLQFGRNAIYKFGASEAASLTLRGNDLVIWEAIRFLAAQGCKSLHLGRTSNDNAGLRRFKQGWGTTEETISYYQWSQSQGCWVDGHEETPRWHEPFFAHMPLFVNRVAGALLYPHLD
jgi:hypothetical protein